MFEDEMPLDDNEVRAVIAVPLKTLPRRIQKGLAHKDWWVREEAQKEVTACQVEALKRCYDLKRKPHRARARY